MKTSVHVQRVLSSSFHPLPVLSFVCSVHCCCSSLNFFFYYHLNIAPIAFFSFCCLSFFVLHIPSHLHPPSTHTFSCPTVSTTTAPPAPLTSTATGGARGQPPPSPSSPPHHHPPPPPPAPPAHGHAPPQLCYQTTLLTARWGP